MSEKYPDDLGGLWIGPGGDYMTGTIGGVKVFVSKNTRATAENRQPHWHVKKSKPKADAPRQTGGAEAQFARGPVTDEDVPF